MHGLTIHFRLRFAVAVTLAAFLVLSLVARESFAAKPRPAREYVVQMKKGHAIAEGRRLVAKLHGQ